MWINNCNSQAIKNKSQNINWMFYWWFSVHKYKWDVIEITQNHWVSDSMAQIHTTNFCGYKWSHDQLRNC